MVRLVNVLANFGTHADKTWQMFSEAQYSARLCSPSTCVSATDCSNSKAAWILSSMRRVLFGNSGIKAGTSLVQVNESRLGHNARLSAHDEMNDGCG
jgi:hypothetical protein